ncbi:hypothetical protein PF011_g23488 [Phytophthora fragariae]|uniref:Uncharacterized protein n=2 Tax=Phytophthora fragariae TaxID=53985 RepID=A0A6A3I6X6_9STRA|nr:hypothetical protein PF011_g23488 [Phytophthora fragariae]
MTPETQIIVRAAPNALGAAGPVKHHADALIPSEEEEKPPAPASTKHSGDPEGAKGAEETTRFQEPTAAATKAKTKKASASSKLTRWTKKVTASSKPASRKPAAKQLPKKKGTAKEGPKTPKLPPKRTDVLLPAPHEEVSSESSDTDTPNPGLIDDAGPAASRHSNAPRASASSPPRPAKANAATTPPQGRRPSPDPSLQVDYEGSESDKYHEVGEAEWSPPQITIAQRVIHPGSPMSPKTVVAVERARVLEASTSRRDDPPPVAQEPQVITNTGVDEEVPPELLQPENRQHLADRSRQTASQALGTKRDRETHAPRTREQLLPLRY